MAGKVFSVITQKDKKGGFKYTFRNTHGKTNESTSVIKENILNDSDLALIDNGKEDSKYIRQKEVVEEPVIKRTVPKRKRKYPLTVRKKETPEPKNLQGRGRKSKKKYPIEMGKTKKTDIVEIKETVESLDNEFVVRMNKLEIQTGIIEYGADLLNSPFLHLLLVQAKAYDYFGIKYSYVIRHKDITEGINNKPLDYVYTNLRMFVKDIQGYDDYQVERNDYNGELVLRIYRGNTVEEYKGFLQVRGVLVSPSIDYCVVKQWQGHYKDVLVPINTLSYELMDYFTNKINTYRREMTRVMSNSRVVITQIRTLGIPELTKTEDFGSDVQKGIKEFFTPNGSNIMDNTFSLIQRDFLDKDATFHIIRLNRDGSISMLRIGVLERKGSMYDYRTFIQQVR